MPQLVFVHGVATRIDADYVRAVANRNKLYQELVFDGQPVDFYSPMWGKFVSQIPAGVFQTNADITAFSLNVSQYPDLVVEWGPLAATTSMFRSSQ
ncbi:hypothetical protein [Klebsiella variicola]|uniref:hypothetical protein n=1 Tax=Klebsiella variicola TaxID=244366 RepID=UPI002B061619|nr:hypothetical protein [Klebsiella variicola]